MSLNYLSNSLLFLFLLPELFLPLTASPRFLRVSLALLSGFISAVTLTSRNNKSFQNVHDVPLPMERRLPECLISDSPCPSQSASNPLSVFCPSRSFNFPSANLVTVHQGHSLFSYPSLHLEMFVPPFRVFL